MATSRVWQANGHSYVALSGFALRMFTSSTSTTRTTRCCCVSQPFPAGGTASTTIFAFKQGGNHYISVSMRGSGTGCGFFVYNVNDPANPVARQPRQSGTDWCTAHEHFVSTDANGDADYAWLTMSAESGSGYKVVVLDLQNLPAMPETGRYQRTDSSGSIFVARRDRDRQPCLPGPLGWRPASSQDKNTLAHNVNPTPLNPIDSIRPSGFNVHHSWPTSDGNHVFIEDEFLNASNAEKIKLYNISNINAPYYETGIVGPGIGGAPTRRTT